MDETQANAIIGRKLRGLRAEKDYSRDKLFELSGIPVITIRRIESGARSAPVPTLIALCQALGADPAEFLNVVQEQLHELENLRGGRTGE